MKNSKRKKLNRISQRSAQSNNLSFRSFSVRQDGPESIDTKNRSVDIVVATEDPVEVFDFERFEIISEVLVASGAQFPQSRQVPLLDTHDRYQTSSVLGSIRELVRERDKVVGRAHFSSVEKVDDTWTKIREGHLTDFSAGYRPLESQWVPEGETYDYKGRSYSGPVRVTKKWKLREGSVVPIGADELAKARSAAGNKHKSVIEEENIMNKRLRKYLEERGLAVGANEDEAWEFFEARSWEQKPQTQEPGNETDRQAELDQIREAAEGEEHDRVVEIMAIGKRYDLAELAYRGVTEKLTVNKVMDLALESVAGRASDPDITHRTPATHGEDASEKFRAAAVDSLLVKAGMVEDPEKMAPGAVDLRGYSLRELARESLRVSGQPTGGNVMEMTGRALATAELPYILANVANKALFSGWDTAAETWRTWCGTDQVSDFKTHYMPRISEFDDLDEIPEHGEYKYGKFTEAQESYSIATYGKLFAITRQTIINDDLGALTRIPASHGESASRKLGDVAYAVLTANAAMGDGVALFATGHSNYVAAGSGAIPGTDTIAAGILAMKTQQDLRGLRRLNIRPEFFLAPAALEGGAEVFFQTIQFSDSDTVATDSSLASTRKNLYSGSYFTRVYETRLDDADPAAWYLAGPRGKTVVMFFLNGVQVPYLETQQGWSVDGTEYKVRIDAGAKAVDWKGLYYNDGN